MKEKETNNIAVYRIEKSENLRLGRALLPSPSLSVPVAWMDPMVERVLLLLVSSEGVRNLGRCPNGFLGLSLNERTILSLMI